MCGLVVLINAPVYADSTMRGSPPLGLLYLGAVLRQHEIPTQLFDLHHEEKSWIDVEDAVSAVDRCVVGFTCNSDNLYRVLHLSDRLLARFAHATVVLGGPHVTHAWEPYVTHRRIVVRGEGEYPMLLLAKHFLEEERTLPEIPGIAYRQDGEVRTNPVSLGPYEDVDAIPIPDYSLLPSPAFYLPAVVTARGCPHHCHFCTEGSHDRAYRPRAAEHVEEELRALKECYEDRVRYLVINDDTFTASAHRVNEICDVIDRVFPDKSRFGFFCEGRVDILAAQPELVRRLKEAGLVRMQIGVESGNQVMLDRLNKNTRVEEIEAVVAACAEAGIPSIFGNFMCGLPGQTPADVENEIAFAKQLADLAPDRIELNMSILTPFPGTEFRTHADKWGLTVLDDDFVTGRMAQTCFAETATLSKEESERFCQRFTGEVGDYVLEKAAPLLTPRKTKELFALAAESHSRAYVIKRLSHFLHVSRVLILRQRADHRFLHEIAEDLIPQCCPVSILDNVVFPGDGSFTINKTSPFEFELTPDQMEYYRYFIGKLSFGEIAQRLAGGKGISEEEAFEECMATYMECEDCLAAITLI